MKTINEIFKEQNPQDGNVPTWRKILVIEYAKQAIKEAAAIYHEHMDSDCFDGEGAEANILNLINELK